MKNNPQIATTEFCKWLETTSFAGYIQPGEQWDTEIAWPSPMEMYYARRCFNEFASGNSEAAEIAMIEAQRPSV